MKPKIYSIAIAAFMGLMACSTANYAQQAAPVAPVAPVPPVPPVPPAHVYVYGSGQASAYTIAPDMYFGPGQSTDTVYKNKMRKLQEELRALNHEMVELSREQSKKTMALQQERMATQQKTLRLRFDSSFNHNIAKGFNSNMRFNFDSDINLQKQVQSGEVKEKSKTFSKSYPVDGNDKLQISNNYGGITVITWAKNEVKVDVDIKSYAMDDAESQKLLDRTSIVTNKENNVVDFKTTIDPEKDSWWGTTTENGKLTKIRKLIINYTVYMPAKSPLTITNKYGAVILPNLGGKLNISNTYGSLVAKALTNADNVISLKYCSTTIGSLNGTDLNLAYGSLDLESADKLNADIRYSPVKIGRLSTTGTFNIRYGDGLQIKDLGKNLKALTVNSSFAPIKLGSLNDVNADFDVTVRMTPFIYTNDVNVTSKTPADDKSFNSTKNYKGHIGKGNADKVITINANYGNGVKFEQ